MKNCFIRFFVFSLLIQAAGPDKNLGNLIRVTIRRWTPVFEVALAVLFNVARDPDGAAPVSNSGGKVVNGPLKTQSGSTSPCRGGGQSKP